MTEPAITSVQNPRVKNAAKLREGRARQKQKRIVLDGVREITRAAEAGVQFAEAFYLPEACGTEAKAALEAIQAGGGELLTVTAAVLEKLSYGGRNEGLVATAVTPRRTLADLHLPERAVVAVLEGVEKPGNVGAVLRTADGAGLDAVIVADGGTDLFNPNTIRASLGTVFSLPTAAASSTEVLAWLRERGFQLLAARVDAAVDYREAEYDPPLALVLGSEAEGLTAAWQGEGVTAITLPMRGRADSLNVAASAAVLFYEATRG